MSTKSDLFRTQVPFKTGFTEFGRTTSITKEQRREFIVSALMNYISLVKEIDCLLSFHLAPGLMNLEGGWWQVRGSNISRRSSEGD